MDSIKTALVGYGYAGRSFHAQLIQHTDGLDLCAVAALHPDERSQAAGLGVKTYASVDELLADTDAELIVLATPHDTHSPLAIQCLDAGRHVVTDKIMCLNTVEADAMIEAARRNSRMLSVFHNSRWSGDYLTLRQVIADGLLGELLTVESRIVMHTRLNPDLWRCQAKHGGGKFFDFGAHLVDQALDLIDSRVVSVYCDMLHSDPAVDVETSACCHIRFANGVRYIVDTGCTSRIHRERWYVQGTKGTFRKDGRLDPQETALRRGEVNANLPQPPEERATVAYETAGQAVERVLDTIPGNWPAYYRNIADHLLKGTELTVKPEGVRRVIAVFDAARQSARENQVIYTDI